MKKIVGLIGVAGVCALLFSACQNRETTVSTAGTVEKSELRFIVVPKVVHPWFDEVNKGAQAEAALLSNWEEKLRSISALRRQRMLWNKTRFCPRRRLPVLTGSPLTLWIMTATRRWLTRFAHKGSLSSFLTLRHQKVQDLPQWEQLLGAGTDGFGVPSQSVGRQGACSHHAGGADRAESPGTV